MHKIVKSLLAASVAVSTSVAVAGNSDINNKDAMAMQEYFKNKLPGVEMSSLIHGAYALDESRFDQFMNIEEFPPYEDFVAKGEEFYNTPFKNGKSFADCFGDDPSAVKAKYPHWDSKKESVVTLEEDINKCLTDNGEKALGWKKGMMAYVSGYLATEARGQTINVVVPDDPKAIAAYEDGKKHFYQKRGQLNLSCADCHVYYGSSYVRSEVLSPATGQASHFPVYRQKWANGSPNEDGLGTLHRRYGGCNKQVRAKPFKAQSEEYKNLEFFHTSMSNGLEYNGPAYRK